MRISCFQLSQYTKRSFCSAWIIGNGQSRQNLNKTIIVMDDSTSIDYGGYMSHIIGSSSYSIKIWNVDLQWSVIGRFEDPLYFLFALAVLGGKFLFFFFLCLSAP